MIKRKILYYSFYPSDASGWYRCTGVFPYINHKELEIVNLCHIRELSFADLCGAYAIFIVRPHEQSHLNLIKLAKDIGLKVIIDHDDNPLCLPLTNPMRDFFEASKKNILESIILADEVWVSTPAIKKAFRLYNKNIHVISNGHHDLIFKVENKKPFEYNKRAMWRGGHSHLGDMYEKGVIESILKLINSNQDWDFYFLGQRFEWLEMRLTGTNFYLNPGASTVQFYKLMHEHNTAIFFYPLSDNLFNRSKSACSFIEATYSGSAYFGSTCLPEFKIPGVEDVSNIHDAMNYSEGLLKDMNETGWDYIQKNLLLSNLNKERLERLLQI